MLGVGLASTVILWRDCENVIDSVHGRSADPLQVEDTLLRLQNAQLQMAERCQEIDDNVEKCEARVSHCTVNNGNFLYGTFLYWRLIAWQSMSQVYLWLSQSLAR